MKREPLTKEKILKEIYSLKEWKMLAEKLDELEEEFKDREDISLIKDNAYHLIHAIINLFNQRVERLLKEIGKEMKKHEQTAIPFKEEGNFEAGAWHDGIAKGLDIARDLIKKAFSGVLEE